MFRHLETFRRRFFASSHQLPHRRLTISHGRILSWHYVVLYPFFHLGTGALDL